MFRAQANQFDEVVAKATDENLTSEDWGRILEVCDRVSATPTGPQSVVAALIKRLAHRNANVQLYTLELAHALSQNCGPPLHRELASRSFTDALLRLVNDRNTHQQVKTKVLERMEAWTELFKGNPDLGIMEQAFDKLRSSNPGLAPPSKPVKREIQDEDRKKEEEELQMALALSLRERSAVESKSQASDARPVQADSQPESQAGTTAATVSRVRALYDFTPSEAGELAFRQGDVIAVLESVYKDWWKGSLRGQTGIFPLNYVEKLQDPTKDELERDAEMEGEVFAQIRNVEKLLALLSVRGEGGMGGRDQGSEEEITELYHQTLAIRPKLIELIGKYSQKKDDFTQLNEKFIKARRDYEALLESSMSQPQQQPGYGYGGRPREQSQSYHQPYGQPPQGYPPRQAQQSYGPQAGPPVQDPHRYYNQPPQSQAPPPPNDYYPPAMNGSTTSPAPFHFIPGGGPQPPSDPRQHTPKPGAPPGMPPSEPPFSPQHSAQGPQPMADRPQSVYTLNSGNPQELASGGYESPVDNRRSYPPAQGFPQQSQQPYHPNSGPPGLQGYPPSQLPIRQRGPSLDGQDPSYPPQQDGQYPPQQYSQPPPAHQAPSSPPPSAPQAQYPSLNSAPPAGGYQAYNPQQSQHPPQPVQAGGGSQYGGGSQAGDDAADYYR